MTHTSVAVSFTGGKDCCLALHRVIDEGFKVAVLVTFAPPDKPFRAHPMAIIKQQAQALGIPHIVCTINGPNYLQSYRDKLLELKEQYDIEALVTGDILQVCSDFMERACEEIVLLIRPLWQLSRKGILEDIWERPFSVMVTCINRRKLPSSDKEADSGVGDLLSPEWLKKHAEKDGADLAGEYGEFHTMVLDSPLFVNGKLKVCGYQKEEDDYLFYHTNSVELVQK
ncbi:hypothetical protein BCR42DRAFT_495032 [Absidia repens]|uniref:Diphthine--ammonia ligase n=1 Tax=Absidia repens TaxID=90262 RepID=A0A1X2I4A5_9FUNG|nr:hypothetical protein BCR42DRAFT_495032 [Absidia repens]